MGRYKQRRQFKVNSRKQERDELALHQDGSSDSDKKWSNSD